MIGTFTINTCINFTKILSNNFDFIIIDREHGLHSFEKVKHLLNASNEKSLKLVRCSNLNKIEIQRTLEANPDGIVIPQISSLNDAKKAIDYTFFAPVGFRGLSPYTEPFDFHHNNHQNKMKVINKKIFLGLLIEGKKGIIAIDEILKNYKKNISLIYFGLYDFSASQGLKADWNNPEIIKAAKKITKSCKKSRIKVGSIARNIKEIKILKKIGFNFIVYQNDSGIFTEALLSIKKHA